MGVAGQPSRSEHRLPRIMRTFAGLGVCALAWGSCVTVSLAGATPDTTTSTFGLVQRYFTGIPGWGPMECVATWNYGVCVPSSDFFVPSISSDGLIVASNFLGMMAFGLQLIILAGLAALILRFLRITILLMGVYGSWPGNKRGAS
jgi:hypothetical protein